LIYSIENKEILTQPIVEIINFAKGIEKKPGSDFAQKTPYLKSTTEKAEFDWNLKNE